MNTPNPICPRCSKQGCPAAKDWNEYCESDAQDKTYRSAIEQAMKAQGVSDPLLAERVLLNLKKVATRVIMPDFTLSEIPPEPLSLETQIGLTAMGILAQWEMDAEWAHNLDRGWDRR